MGTRRKFPSSTVIRKRRHARRQMTEESLPEMQDITHRGKLLRIARIVWDGICHFFVTLFSYNAALMLYATSRQFFSRQNAEQKAESADDVENASGESEKMDGCVEIALQRNDEDESEEVDEEIGGVDGGKAIEEKEASDSEMDDDVFEE
ncbi:hypothetical protein PMAYCL1PPCAC_30492, partial [Pristionchus mayeri]